MQTTINERIKEIADQLFSGNISAMAKATFISRTTILSIIGEKETTPGFDVLHKIVEMSTHNISPNWLLTGQGEMLNGAANNSGNIANISGNGANKVKQEITHNGGNPGSQIDNATLLKVIDQQNAMIDNLQKQLISSQEQVAKLIDKLL